MRQGRRRDRDGNDPAMTMDQISKAVQVSRSALYRQLGSALQQEQSEAGRIAGVGL